jgi:hypothetical protein
MTKLSEPNLRSQLHRRYAPERRYRERKAVPGPVATSATVNVPVLPTHTHRRPWAAVLTVLAVNHRRGPRRSGGTGEEVAAA